jgi:hypothetical protein
VDIEGAEGDAEAQGSVAGQRVVQGLSPSMDVEVERAAQRVSVPKAPLIPRDLAKMPNRALPRWSGRPAEPDAPSEQSRRHTDADLPPPIRFDSGQPPAPGTSAAGAPASPSLASIVSAKPTVPIEHSAPSVAGSRSKVPALWFGALALFVLAVLFAWLR